MDRFLSIFEGKSQNQKILIGVGLLVFVFVLMVLSFLLTTPKINNQKTSENSDTNKNLPTDSTSLPSNSLPLSSSFPNINQTNIPKGWETYRYSDYQISYPSDFVPQLGTISGGGVSIFLIQNIASSAASQNYIEIQVYDAKDVSLQQISSGLSAFGHTKSVTKVGIISAQKFSGSIFATSSASLRMIAVIFEDNGRTFKIQLNYLVKSQNNQIESLFNKIVSTFSFNLPQ